MCCSVQNSGRPTDLFNSILLGNKETGDASSLLSSPSSWGSSTGNTAARRQESTIAGASRAAGRRAGSVLHGYSRPARGTRYRTPLHQQCNQTVLRTFSSLLRSKDSEAARAARRLLSAVKGGRILDRAHESGTCCSAAPGHHCPGQAGADRSARAACSRA